MDPSSYVIGHFLSEVTFIFAVNTITSSEYIFACVLLTEISNFCSHCDSAWQEMYMDGPDNFQKDSRHNIAQRRLTRIILVLFDAVLLSGV
jgi:hypothetical protein